jgi:hypothetical protein
MRSVWRWFGFTLYLGWAQVAAADPLPKRTLPDYDGRPDPGATPTEVIAWAPRVVLFPLWVVTEFVVRRPLGWLVTHAEQGHWPTALLQFFTFGEEQKFGVVPTFFVDLGFRPNAGLYLFWDEAGHPSHSMRFRASGWIDAFTVSFADRWQTDKRGSRFETRGSVSRRPDRLFWGLGPRSLEENKARFGELRFVGSVAQTLRGGYGEMISLEAGFRSVDFREAGCCDGAHIEDLVADGTFPSPPGLADGGYQAIYQRLVASADTRSPRPNSQTGLRLAESDRVLGLTLTTAFAGAPRGEVPFTELVDLAGQEVMQGLRPGRLRGESGIAASLRYEWPIWAALGGTLQVDCGNVFDEWLDGFDPELLRLSFAFGIRTLGSGDHGLQVVLGAGTETFADGTDLTSIRFAIGGTYGF